MDIGLTEFSRIWTIIKTNQSTLPITKMEGIIVIKVTILQS
jgi:hypothetical protein